MAAPKPTAELRSAGGVQYELYRKKIKQLHLRVRDNGTVMVSIPLRTSLEQADALVVKNAQWIRDTRQRVMAKSARDNANLPDKETALAYFTAMSDQVYPAFARVLGGQEILSMAYNLGFGSAQEFGRGLWTAAGELPDAASLQHPRALANFAFGQGELTATPLQLCAVLNTVASGGVYATPKLIAGEVDENKRLSPLAPVTDKEVRVMSVSTAKNLQRYLETAAREGALAIFEDIHPKEEGTQ